jgi:NitT/TauT family transport system substrate-binding protein
MDNAPCIRIGHLKIVDHLIIGITSLCIKNDAGHLFAGTFESLPMNSWEQLTDSLGSGETDGAFMPAPLAMDLFSRGMDIKILMFTHRSGSLIVKKNGAGIRKISDFKGRVILVSSAFSIQTMLLHRLMSSAGLTFGAHDDADADVSFEVVSPGVMADMLIHDQDNDIAGFAVSDPFAGMAVSSGIAQKVCASDDLWKNHPGCVFVLNNAVIKNHPETVKELMDLFVKTAGRIEPDMDDDTLLTQAGDFLNLDRPGTGQVLSGSRVSFLPELLMPDIELLKIIQNYMTGTMKVLHHKFNITDLVDDSFIQNLILETSHED